jgi:integrase
MASDPHGGSALLVDERGSEKGKGSLHVRAYKGRPFYEARWRDLHRIERRRRLGKAWVELDEDEEWIPRRGRVRSGYLDERRAYPLMAQVIEAHEKEQRETTPALRQARFDDAVAAWLIYLKTEKRVKPSTLSGYRSLLAKPTGKRKARIMRKFGGHRLFSITTKEVRQFLAKLDREDISARTVNIHRQVLHSIFEFAGREDSFGLPANPAAETTKRPEDGAKPIETFEPDEIRAIAKAAREGLHRGKGGYEHSVYSLETEREWQRINEQDAALFTIAAFTGLRLGELLALRWHDVDLKGGVLSVSRAMSAGEESSTKSRRSRVVPLAQQAKDALKMLRRRGHFTSRNDFVFCRTDGGPLDRSAVRKRFIRAQKKAGVRVRRFHDLRHTFGSLAIRRFDLVAVKEMMGHSKLTTTERYLHSKPRPSDAARLTAIFAEHEDSGQLALAA